MNGLGLEKEIGSTCKLVVLVVLRRKTKQTCVLAAYFRLNRRLCILWMCIFGPFVVQKKFSVYISSVHSS